MSLPPPTPEPHAARNALTDGRHTRRYDELPGATARVADRLADGGVTADGCVALECGNTMAGALTLLALLGGGRPFLLLPPVDPRTDPAGARRDVPPFCRHHVVLDEAAEPEGAARVTEHAGWNGARFEGEDAAVFLLTSGSTRRPKVAAHSHASLRANAHGCVERLALTAGDRVAIPVPIHHMYGLGAALLPALEVGASVDLQAGANVLSYLARERDFAPDVSFLIPGLCSALVRTRKAPRPARLTVSAGDRLGEDVFAAYQRLHGPLVSLYGSTELGAVAAAAPGEPDALRARTVGTPLTDVTVTVADEARGHELRVRHQHAFSGYADEAGVPSFDERGDPRDDYGTRDHGRVLASGHVEVHGRLDHQVKREGRLVAFRDVEEALEELPGVERAAVLAAEPGPRGDELVAYCVPAAGADLDEGTLRRGCLAALPKYAIPDRVVIAHDLPLLRSGKVDRPGLARRLRADA